MNGMEGMCSDLNIFETDLYATGTRSAHTPYHRSGREAKNHILTFMLTRPRFDLDPLTWRASTMPTRQHFIKSHGNPRNKRMVGNPIGTVKRKYTGKSARK